MTIHSNVYKLRRTGIGRSTVVFEKVNYTLLYKLYITAFLHKKPWTVNIIKISNQSCYVATVYSNKITNKNEETIHTHIFMYLLWINGVITFMTITALMRHPIFSTFRIPFFYVEPAINTLSCIDLSFIDFSLFGSLTKQSIL